MLRRSKCLLLLILSTARLGYCHPVSRDEEDKRKQRTISKTLETLNNIVEFYGTEYKKFNIDGIFGLQALDGVLQQLLHKLQTNQISTSSHMLQLLTHLHVKAAMIANKSQPFLKASDPDYFRLGFVAQHAWNFSREFRSLDTSLAENNPQENRDESRDMRTMDQCISDLIGNKESGSRPCNITKACWEFIRSENTKGYMTTHQALYFMVGEVKGCSEDIKVLLSKSSDEDCGIEGIFERLCASTYKEMIEKEHEIAQKGQGRSPTEKDLYMEQCYVCGILGYYRFLSLDRLAVIMGWQLPLGCYGRKINWQNVEEGKELNKESETHESSEIDEDERKINHFEDKRSRERKRETVEQTANDLPDGCERHITGVATGLLGVYMKWLLTAPSLDYFYNYAM